jgi:hypothetical protein
VQLSTPGLDQALLEKVTARLEKLRQGTDAQIVAGDVMAIVERALKGEVSSETLRLLGLLTSPSRSFGEGRFGKE